MKKLLLILITIFSCVHKDGNNSSVTANAKSSIYITSFTVTLINGGPKSKVKRKLEVLNKPYFDIRLGSLNDGGYGAENIDKSDYIGKDFIQEGIMITGKDSTQVEFKTSTDFLNYMADGGYDLINQVPNEYGADYTFKKK